MAVAATSSTTTLSIKETTKLVVVRGNVFGYLRYFIGECYSVLTLGEYITAWWYATPIFTWEKFWLIEAIYDIALFVLYVAALAGSSQVDVALWIATIISNFMAVIVCCYFAPLFYWTHKLSFVKEAGDLGGMQNRFFECKLEQVDQAVLADDQVLFGVKLQQTATIKIMLYDKSSGWKKYNFVFMLFIWYWCAVTAILVARQGGSTNSILVLAFCAPQLGLFLLMKLLRRSKLYVDWIVYCARKRASAV